MEKRKGKGNSGSRKANLFKEKYAGSGSDERIQDDSGIQYL